MFRIFMLTILCGLLPLTALAERINKKANEIEISKAHAKTDPHADTRVYSQEPNQDFPSNLNVQKTHRKRIRQKSARPASKALNHGSLPYQTTPEKTAPNESAPSTPSTAPQTR